jgi:coenzyme F420-reducing hydrogenase delta subunit
MYMETKQVEPRDNVKVQAIIKTAKEAGLSKERVRQIVRKPDSNEKVMAMYRKFYKQLEPTMAKYSN